MSFLTLPTMNGSHARPAGINSFNALPTAEEWLQSSVREFFSQFNWDDRPLTLQDFGADSVSPKPLSLDMSVGYYFSAIDWEGSAIAAPIPTSAPLPAQSNDLTLDDFSSLF